MPHQGLPASVEDHPQTEVGIHQGLAGAWAYRQRQSRHQAARCTALASAVVVVVAAAGQFAVTSRLPVAVEKPLHLRQVLQAALGSFRHWLLQRLVAAWKVFQPVENVVAGETASASCAADPCPGIEVRSAFPGIVHSSWASFRAGPLDRGAYSVEAACQDVLQHACEGLRSDQHSVPLVVDRVVTKSCPYRQSSE